MATCDRINEGEDDNSGAWKEYSSTSDSYLIVCFQFIQNTVELRSKVGKYADIDILIDSESSYSVLNNKKILFDPKT